MKKKCPGEDANALYFPHSEAAWPKSNVEIRGWFHCRDVTSSICAPGHPRATSQVLSPGACAGRDPRNSSLSMGLETWSGFDAIGQKYSSSTDSHTDGAISKQRGCLSAVCTDSLDFSWLIQLPASFSGQQPCRAGYMGLARALSMLPQYNASRRGYTKRCAINTPTPVSCVKPVVRTTLLSQWHSRYSVPF